MFNNIGKKIKIMAITFFIVQAILDFLDAVAAFKIAYLSEQILDRFWDLVWSMVKDLLEVLIFTWVLYGFGELVENSAIIAKKMNKSFSGSNNSNTAGQNGSVGSTIQNGAKPQHRWNGKCQMCDADNVMVSEAIIVDDLGTRYRDVCADCYQKYGSKLESDTEADLTEDQSTQYCCAQCDTNVSFGTKYCPNCGRKFEWEHISQ